MNISIGPTNLFEQFARTLMTSLDANRDGQLSTTEFTSFLTRFASAGIGTDSPISPAQHAMVDEPGKRSWPASTRQSWETGTSHTTVKYLFGRVAQRYNLLSVRDHASAESLLLQMRPDLEAAGIIVLDVSRDKIQVLDDQG